MSMVEIRCEQCGQRLRVPSDKGNLDVTCPKCRHRKSFSGMLLKKLAIAAGTGYAFQAGADAAQAADLFGTGAASAATPGSDPFTTEPFAIAGQAACTTSGDFAPGSDSFTTEHFATAGQAAFTPMDTANSAAEVVSEAPFDSGELLEIVGEVIGTILRALLGGE